MRVQVPSSAPEIALVKFNGLNATLVRSRKWVRVPSPAPVHALRSASGSTAALYVASLGSSPGRGSKLSADGAWALA